MLGLVPPLWALWTKVLQMQNNPENKDIGGAAKSVKAGESLKSDETKKAKKNKRHRQNRLKKKEEGKKKKNLNLKLLKRQPKS